MPDPAAPPPTASSPVASSPPASIRRVYRHRLPVRVMHWINALCFFVLLMSGLNIFNAHPALYWGKDSDFDRPWVAVGARQSADGALIGHTRIGSVELDTTGWLGVSGPAGSQAVRAFPSWATIPGPQWLAMARNWHLFFAWVFVINGLAYVVYTVAARHLGRDLLPTGAELRGIGRSIRQHLLLRHAQGEAARRYNVLQQLAYLAVIFLLVPLLVVGGLAMSPALDAVWAGWVDLLGGRQSARTLHFLAGLGLVLFVLVHLFEVLVAGAWNEIRSMVTGWYVLPPVRSRRPAADHPPSAPTRESTR